MCAQWMDAAARRGPFGSTGALQRLLRLAPQEEEAPLLPPTSNFALCDGTFFFLRMMSSHLTMLAFMHAAGSALSASASASSRSTYVNDASSETSSPCLDGQTRRNR